MAKVKFFLKKKGVKNSDKTSEATVYLRFYHGKATDVTSTTHEIINPNFWDASTEQIKSKCAFNDKERLRFNSVLNNLKNAVSLAFSKVADKKIDKEWLDMVIDKFYYPSKYLDYGVERPTLKDFIARFLKTAPDRQKDGKTIDKKTVMQYKSANSYFIDYCDYKDTDFDFDDITKKWYDEYSLYLSKERGLSKSTVGAKIKNLKVFMKEAQSNGFHSNTAYQDFKVLKEPGDDIALTKDERDTIYNLDLSGDKSLERVRDWFILLCCTGCRYSDLINISNWDREDDLFIINQEKTDEVAYIPISPMVSDIIKKYDGNIPTPISNQRFNEYIKEIACMAGLNNVETKYRTIGGEKKAEKLERWRRVSSHTGRRTFCTIEHLNGTPIQSIMAASGHRTEESLLNYIKIDRKQHAKKLVDTWKKQRENEKLIEIIESLSDDARKELLSNLSK